ncbi:E3 ubiquitin-protein ligase RNF170 isoform X2 [Bemisia tabaci]|uniref:E3 ubiquitin-protein ligase RNF170 isoform X2 n=1 Tax=Bemisia tabaci TaxID=7038 RepID=UPI003B284108
MDSYIYGIGNEVLYLFGGVALVFALFIHYFLVTARNQESTQADEATPSQFYNILPTFNRACPVCLGNPVFKVATNCGHAYCGSCLLQLVHHSRPRITVHCAVCRSTVTWIIEQFSDEERENCSEQALTLKASVTHLKRCLSVYSRSDIDEYKITVKFITKLRNKS